MNAVGAPKPGPEFLSCLHHGIHLAVNARFSTPVRRVQGHMFASAVQADFVPFSQEPVDSVHGFRARPEVVHIAGIGEGNEDGSLQVVGFEKPGEIADEVIMQFLDAIRKVVCPRAVVYFDRACAHRRAQTNRHGVQDALCEDTLIVEIPRQAVVEEDCFAAAIRVYPDGRDAPDGVAGNHNRARGYGVIHEQHAALDDFLPCIGKGEFVPLYGDATRGHPL